MAYMNQLANNKFNQYGGADGKSHSQGAQNVVAFLNKVALYTANTKPVFRAFTDTMIMDRNSGKTFKVVRRQHIYDRELSDPEFNAKGFISSRSVDDVLSGLASRTLTEGQTTAKSETLKEVTISTELKRYGAYLEYTGDIKLFSNFDCMMYYHTEMGNLAQQMMEDLVQIDMLSTTNVMYAGAGTSLETMGTGVSNDGSLDSKWTVSYNLVEQIVDKLKRNRAQKNTTAIVASDKVGTKPIPEAYYALVGAEVASNLKNLVRSQDNLSEFAFIPSINYSNSAKVTFENEIGAIGGVRFIQPETMLNYEGKGTTVPSGYTGNLRHTGEAGTGKFNVYPILVPSMNSFKVVGLKGENKLNTYIIDNKPQINNVFGQKGGYSFTFLYAGLITQPERLLKVLVCATQPQA